MYIRFCGQYLKNFNLILLKQWLYPYFEDYEPTIFRALAKLFSKTALEVCEGQQYDVDFETRDDVTIPEYIKMIEFINPYFFFLCFCLPV